MLIFTADAGHGLTTPGKETPDKIKEWSFNNKVLLGYQKEIEQYDGVKFYRLDDPTGKKDIPLVDRVKAMIAYKSDNHKSFHQNALNAKWGSHGGTETYVCNKHTTKEMELAKRAQQVQISTLGLRNRGVKKADFYIINNTYKVVDGKKNKIPSILLESAFMDSNTDKEILRMPGKLEQLGKELAISDASYYGLKKKSAASKPEVKPVTPVTPVPPVSNVKTTGTIKVLVDNLNYYNAPRWTKPIGTVKKNTVLTVVDKIKVDGAWQYKLKSGTYITASDKYVKFTAK